MTTLPYTLRPATAADADTIERMVRSENLNHNAIDWHYFLVLEVVDDDGKPTMASIGMSRPEIGFYEIDSVTTRPEFRGRGYAEAIVNALISGSPRPLFLLSETRLIPFYEKFSFRVFLPDDAPTGITEQADSVNAYFQGRITYHVMGKLD